MAAYKDIIGQKITKVTSNPPEPKTGQMWYNSTDGALRGLGVTSAWRSSAPLLVARDAAGSAGTQTTATIFGGNINPGNTSATDEYNGSGFSSGGTLGTARRQTTGCGLQTAALCVGGYTTANAANVEEYNGTSWSEQNDIPGNYRNGSSFGTQTAALYVGGYSVPVPNSDVIQIYDGTNWTTSPATLGTGGNDMSSTGTSTAGLVFGGSNRLNLTEEWNGTAMSAGGNLTTSKYGRGSANQAPSENAMSAGGGIPAQTTVENYNGTTWSTLPSLAVATNSIRGAGTATSAMMMGGGPGAGPVFNTSTEFDQSTNTITAGAWASGGNLNTARRAGANSSSGTQSASFYAAGGPPGVNNTEEYDGSSWSNGNNTGNTVGSTTGAGTLTSGLLFGGETPGTPAATITEEYDGTNWTSGGTLTTGRRALGGCGLSQTAGLGFGGADSTNAVLTATEEYDGTSWTNGGSLPVAKRSMGACGSQTAGLGFGGYATTIFNTTEEYDGTNWTSGGALPVAKSITMGSGTQTAALSSGGATPTYPYSPITNVVGYDGTAWSTRPSIATSRGAGKGSGTNTAGLVFGGTTDAGATFTAATEEFTGETSAANITDFTTS